MSVIAVIPAYKPDEKLIEITQLLKAEGLGVLIIDDGSGEKYSSVFNAAHSFGAKILTNHANLGKGAALKNAFCHILDLFPDCTALITADSDGQHSIADILRVRDALLGGAEFVITERKPRKGVPFRSKLGNVLSVCIFAALTGHYYIDNQSGLRGFSASQLPWMKIVPGSHYNYELNLLYYAEKQQIKETTLMIDTIYIDGNSSSHFRPIMDTFRIYGRLFESAKFSLLGLVLGEALAIFLANLSVSPVFLPLLTAASGIIVCLFRELLNRFVQFRAVKYKDTARMAVFTMWHYAFAGLGVLLLGKLAVPFFVAFNISLALCMIIEHFILKLISKINF